MVFIKQIMIQELLSEEELLNVPFVVLGNKIDMPGAASEQELRISLNLVDTYGKDVRDEVIE